MAIKKSPYQKIAVVDWDWKARPNWAEIMQAVQFVEGKPFFTETHADDYAVVISSEPISQRDADRIYDQAFGGEWDELEKKAE